MYKKILIEKVNNTNYTIKNGSISMDYVLEDINTRLKDSNVLKQALDLLVKHFNILGRDFLYYFKKEHGRNFVLAKDLVMASDKNDYEDLKKIILELIISYIVETMNKKTPRRITGNDDIDSKLSSFLFKKFQSLLNGSNSFSDEIISNPTLDLLDDHIVDYVDELSNNNVNENINLTEASATWNAIKKLGGKAFRRVVLGNRQERLLKAIYYVLDVNTTTRDNIRNRLFNIKQSELESLAKVNASASSYLIAKAIIDSVLYSLDGITYKNNILDNMKILMYNALFNDLDGVPNGKSKSNTELETWLYRYIKTRMTELKDNMILKDLPV